MKKLIVLVLVTAIFLTGSQFSYAGDSEWATAGKILAGVVGVSVLSDMAASRPYYGYSSHHYYHPRYRYYRSRHGRRYHYHRPRAVCYDDCYRHRTYVTSYYYGY